MSCHDCICGSGYWLCVAGRPRLVRTWPALQSEYCVCCSQCCVVCPQANETTGQHGSVLVKRAGGKTWLGKILQCEPQCFAPRRSRSGGGWRRMTTFQGAKRFTHCVPAFRTAAAVLLHRRTTITPSSRWDVCLLHHIDPLRPIMHRRQSATVKPTGLRDTD